MFTRSLSVLIAAVLLSPTIAVAGTSHYHAYEGSWSTSGNWYGGIPVAGDSVYLGCNDTQVVNYLWISNYSAAAETIMFGYGSSGNPHYAYLEIQSGGSLTNGATYLGYEDAASGYLTVLAGGTHTISNQLWITAAEGGTGVYRLAGGTLTMTNNTASVCRGNGDSTFIYDSGTLNMATSSSINVQKLYVGKTNGFTGTMSLANNNAVTVDSLWVGYQGNGTVNQATNSGINVLVSTDFRLGESAGRSGTYNLTSGNLGVGNNEFVGIYGTGTIHQDGGGNGIGGAYDLWLGYYTGSTGVYNLHGGTLAFGNAGRNIYVGRDDANGGAGRFEWFAGNGTITGSPTMHFRPGAHTGTLAMGWAAPIDIDTLVSGGYGVAMYGLDSAILEITNGATANQDGSWSGYQLDVGSSTGSGTYNLSVGTGSVTNLRVGTGAGSPTGVLNIASGVANATNLAIGADTSSGTVKLAGGTLNVTNAVVNGSGTGTLIVAGGTFSPSSNVNVDYIKIGDVGSGAHTQAASTCTVGNNLTLGGNVGQTGVYRLSGGVLNVTGQVVNDAGNGTLILNGGTFNPSGSVGVDDLTVGESNSASFTQAAAAFTVADALTLGGNVGKSGTYRVNSGASINVGRVVNAAGTGTLILNGGSFGCSGDVDVDSLQVAETVSASYAQSGHAYTVGGDLAVGVSPGASGTYTLNAGSLSVGNHIVGNAGSAMVYNGGELVVGGDIAIGSFNLADAFGGNVSYELSGNQITTQTTRIGGGGSGSFEQSGGAHSVSANLVVGGAGSGSYHFTGGTLSGAGGLVVRETLAGAGSFSGRGVVGLTGPLINNGQIVADGGGLDATLDLSGLLQVLNSIENPAKGRSGWYAVDHGRLELPALHIDVGPHVYNWGESPYEGATGEKVIDLVNSAQIDFSNVSVPGELSIALLSLDREEVPALPAGAKFIAAYEFSPAGGLQFDPVTITFRYSEGLMEECGLYEDSLRIYHFENGQWTDVWSITDTDLNLITSVPVDHFSYFAVGEVPEPATVTMLLVGAAIMLRVRKKARP